MIRGFVLLLSLVLVGCAEHTRLDATSDETLHRSIAAARGELDGAERREFDNLVASAVASTVMAGLRGEPRTLSETMAGYDRLTPREALARHASQSPRREAPSVSTPAGRRN